MDYFQYRRYLLDKEKQLAVLNLIINGLLSILKRRTYHMYGLQVLNLIINGLLSI